MKTLLFRFLFSFMSLTAGLLTSSCSEPPSSKTKDIIGQLNQPVELWICNYEQYDLFVALQGEYGESGKDFEFNKGWVLVPKRTPGKEYSCVDVTSVIYTFPAGVNPMSPGAKTDKYAIGGTSANAFVRTENGYYTPTGYSSYSTFANDAYATLCVPEIGAQSTLTAEGRAPFILDYPIAPSHNSMNRLCPKDSRRVAALELRFQWDSSMTRPFGSGEWGDDGDGERFRYDFRDGQSSEAPVAVENDQYGYDVKSPVPVEVRKTVREDIIPRAPVQGGQLELALKQWKGQLTPKQVLVLQTVIELGKAFKLAATQTAESAKAITERLASITAGAAQAVKDVAVCLVKVGAAGDYGDWYEITTGKDFCDGSELTLAGRGITAIGVIAGQGKFWRAVGETFGVSTSIAKAGKKAFDIIEEFKPRFQKLSAQETEQAIGEMAKISRQKGFKSPEELDSILREVENVLEVSDCSPFIAFESTHSTILDRVMGLVEGRAYAASCPSSKVKQFVIDEFRKNANYRADFLTFTKKTADEVKGFDCHHVFPQKFRDQFTKLKVKIDDPKLLTWWQSTPHKQAAKAYNQAWARWFLDNPNATTEQTLAFGKKLAQEAGLTIYF
ncbi:MAG: hypothetical protein M3Q07_26565 [Pseudobdellovibrionaceae bacterium]|nr:hypothetical protein [Pseudobdellovibrionaceae bacterium]